MMHICMHAFWQCIFKYPVIIICRHHRGKKVGLPLRRPGIRRRQRQMCIRDRYYPCPQGIHIYWRNSKKVVFTMRGRVWGTETFELQDEQNKVQKKVVISSQTGRIRIE